MNNSRKKIFSQKRKQKMNKILTVLFTFIFLNLLYSSYEQKINFLMPVVLNCFFYFIDFIVKDQLLFKNFVVD